MNSKKECEVKIKELEKKIKELELDFGRKVAQKK